jgi:hypothetical protein
MRKHLRGPTAALTVLVLVALMLVVGRPQRADAAIVYFGIAESSASFQAGPTQPIFTFHWRFSIARDTATNNVRYRAHLWCTRNGANTACNFRNDNAWLFYKNCAPSDTSVACERTIDGYGPRDFPGCPAYCNISHAYYNGGWHPNNHTSWRSVSYAGMQARFLAINHLTNTYSGCSRWATASGVEWPPPHCPASS